MSQGLKKATNRLKSTKICLGEEKLGFNRDHYFLLRDAGNLTKKESCTLSGALFTKRIHNNNLIS